MHKLLRGAVVLALCATFGMADAASTSAGAHGFHRFHGLYGYRGFYGLYPYTLFGYPNYRYGSYYPLSPYYVDNEPNCDFVWSKPTAKHKSKGRWTCS